ncbi:MAG: hypothetical protein AB8G15_04950 [Saprospiraceae bacterium]
MNLTEIYQERAKRFEQLAASLQDKYNKFALIRLLSFVLGLGILIYLWAAQIWLGAVGTFIFLLAFGKFMHWHLALQKTQIHSEQLHQINLQELAVLNNDLSAFEDGEEFMDPAHPYAIDLDIFGPYSFFHYANRTSSAIGKHMLAEYLTQPPTLEEVKRRQASIAELKEDLDWRQNFQAHGRTTADKIQHVDALKEWLTKPNFIVHQTWLQWAMYIVPIIVTVGSIYIFLNLSWAFFLLLFALPFAILKYTLDHINTIHHQTNQAGEILIFYAKLIEHIEQKDFSSEKLQQLKTGLHTEGALASKQIDRLAYIITQLNKRNNFFAIFLNLFGLWDLHWTVKLEKWKIQQKNYLPRWFDALKEFEALSSLGTMFFNNDDWIFPILHQKDIVEAVALGHPLLSRTKRICNDVSIPTEAHIKLITGSNMAGKSTFLRTVGLNIVLAMIGSPVCAKRFELPLLSVYSSMRTQDALHESTSSFYAELKRLKIIIDAIEERAQHKDTQRQVFFLMDEILKGTNSRDRHTGSKALIKQLIESKGSGIIATHDLELGVLEASYGGAIENLCIEVTVENAKLVFDYKVKKGISQSFNATHLMREMGIKIPS